MKWWLHHFPTWRHRQYCRLAAKMRINHMELWEGCSIVIRNDDNLWFKTNIYIYIYIPWRIHGAGIYANIWGIWMVNVTIYSIHGSYGYIYIYNDFFLYWPLMGHSDIGKDIKKSIPCFLSSPWLASLTLHKISPARSVSHGMCGWRDDVCHYTGDHLHFLSFLVPWPTWRLCDGGRLATTRWKR